jgi:hypothetical protein
MKTPLLKNHPLITPWNFRSIRSVSISLALQFLIFLPVYSQTYCAVTTSNPCTAASGNPTISNFTLGSIVNNSGCSSGSYQDYSSSVSYPALETTLIPGTAYPYSVRRLNADFASAYSLNIWVDLDDNFVFDASERLAYIPQTPNCAGFICPNPPAQTGTITIPPGTSGGTKRLRLRIVYNGDSQSLNVPCGNTAYGETEDYRIIVPGSAATITTSPVSPLTYCAGNSANVSFSISGTFNAGNTFTAQLSDAAGSFSNPTSIGTLSGINAGTISATIPSGSPAGVGYRIRVVSSDPAVTGTVNSSDIMLNTVPQVSLTPPASTSICTGGTITLSGSTNSGTIAWQQSANGVNFSAIAGEAGTSFTSPAINADTWFKFSATNSCGTSESSAIQITVSASATQQITQSPNTTNLCNGPITLSVPASLTNFTWSNSQTGTSIVVNTPGNYSGSGNGIGGCLTTTNTVVIIQTTPAPMSTSPQGNVTSCEDSVILTAVNGFTSYTWTTTDTTQAIEVNTSGEYSVSGQDANGCTSVSPPINVTIDSGPPAVISITPAGPLSFCTGSPITLVAQSGFQNYVWSNAQTGASISVNASGTYSVTAENSSGCSAASADVVVTEIDIPQASFTYEQPSGYTVLFTNTTSYGGTFLWDFGAGITVTQESPSFTFPFDGVYDVKLVASNACGTDSVTISVEVKKIAGYQDISKELENVHLIANPVRQFASLTGETAFTENYTLKIMDGLGREIRQEFWKVQGSWVKNIDLSNETNGIYWVIIEDSKNHRSVKKLILL